MALRGLGASPVLAALLESAGLAGKYMVEAFRCGPAFARRVEELRRRQGASDRGIRQGAAYRLALARSGPERVAYLQRSLSVFKDLGAHTRMKEIQNSVHRALMGR